MDENKPPPVTPLKDLLLVSGIRLEDSRGPNAPYRSPFNTGKSRRSAPSPPRNDNKRTEPVIRVGLSRKVRSKNWWPFVADRKESSKTSRAQEGASTITSDSKEVKIKSKRSKNSQVGEKIDRQEEAAVGKLQSNITDGKKSAIKSVANEKDFCETQATADAETEEKQLECVASKIEDEQEEHKSPEEINSINNVVSKTNESKGKKKKKIIISDEEEENENCPENKEPVLSPEEENRFGNEEAIKPSGSREGIKINSPDNTLKESNTNDAIKQSKNLNLIINLPQLEVKNARRRSGQPPKVKQVDNKDLETDIKLKERQFETDKAFSEKRSRKQGRNNSLKKRRSLPMEDSDEDVPLSKIPKIEKTKKSRNLFKTVIDDVASDEDDSECSNIQTKMTGKEEIVDGVHLKEMSAGEENEGENNDGIGEEENKNAAIFDVTGKEEENTNLDAGEHENSTILERIDFSKSSLPDDDDFVESPGAKVVKRKGKIRRIRSESDNEDREDKMRNSQETAAVGSNVPAVTSSRRNKRSCRRLMSSSDEENAGGRSEGRKHPMKKFNSNNSFSSIGSGSNASKTSRKRSSLSLKKSLSSAALTDDDDNDFVLKPRKSSQDVEMSVRLTQISVEKLLDKGGEKSLSQENKNNSTLKSTGLESDEPTALLIGKGVVVKLEDDDDLTDFQTPVKNKRSTLVRKYSKNLGDALGKQESSKTVDAAIESSSCDEKQISDRSDEKTSNSETIVAEEILSVPGPDKSNVTESAGQTIADLDVLRDEVYNLEVSVYEKERHLEELKRAVHYKQIHDIADLNRRTALWKSGCKEALYELLNKMKENVPAMEMKTLLGRLNIPEDFVDFDEENDCFK